MLTSNQGPTSEVLARGKKTGVRVLAMAKTKAFLIVSEQRLKEKTLAIGTFGEMPGEPFLYGNDSHRKKFLYGQSVFRKTYDAIFNA